MMINTIEKGSAYGIKNSRFKTLSPKYSSNLYCDPMGSTNFTKPEKINMTPTNNLDKCTNNFNIMISYLINRIICLNESSQKQHSLSYPDNLHLYPQKLEFSLCCLLSV